ncbi:unnamed protein product [Ectocarpus sp. 12 AP-2014]
MDLLGRGGLTPHLFPPSSDLTSSSDRPRRLALFVVKIVLVVVVVVASSPCLA